MHLCICYSPQKSGQFIQAAGVEPGDSNGCLPSVVLVCEVVASSAQAVALLVVACATLKLVYP